MWGYCIQSDTVTDSESLKFKSKFTGNINATHVKHVEMAAPLKYIPKFGRTF